MAKDHTVGPVTLYDAFGNPINPTATSDESTEEIVEAPPDLPKASVPGLKATLQTLKMPDLRKMAEQFNARPARSREETIERILVAFSVLKKGEGVPETLGWQAPPPTEGAAPGIQKSVRVRRIEEASGKKGE